ncbi:hypothetical protein JZ751_021721 [Albula glossodonta]|uniref:Signal transducer and activator of transcription n=1 Tax=Albula glossodonta TaxID=121402 RepID=A0A8T2NJS3_9TELE|nr:hypothetical protein JZ751_021721 [Albula glossodonta]
MAQWKQVQLQLQYLSTQDLNELYPPAFPMDVRCYLASWIEEQLAQESSNVVERMRLQHIARNMNGFRSQPIQLVKTVQSTLKKERILLGQVLPAFSPSPSPGHAPLPGMGLGPGRAEGAWGQQRDVGNRDVDTLVLKVLEIQECRKKIHQLQEELNWERANFESIQVSLPASLSNGLDPKASEQVNKFQNRIQQLEFNGQEYAKKRVQLLQEAVDCLEHCQSRLIHRIKCEQLLGVNDKLRQEVILVGRDCLGAEPITELQERLRILLQTLVQSSLMVDKQPPQVIKTQSKFSTTVRYLLGEKVTPGKPVLLKAQIITEVQARNLGQLGSIPTENVGELINNTAILEHNSSTKSTCATFRNMGSESVTEEKFALLFSSEISITGCDTPYCIQMISLPIVVIVHGSQDNNALATIIWDCAFSEPDRVPFVVPERVPWLQMCKTLDSKFRSEVQTQRSLDRYNQHFLAQKIFDKPDISGDFNNMLVSWAQFNKEVLPGRAFTFWQWFDGVMELTKKHLKCYWSDGLIFGFIGKQHLHLILQDRPDGTFLLRFSDSEIGGITIAYVSSSENRGRKIQNIQPFTKKDLEIRCLGDRIRDIEFITHGDFIPAFFDGQPTGALNSPSKPNAFPVRQPLPNVSHGQTHAVMVSMCCQLQSEHGAVLRAAKLACIFQPPQGNGVFSPSDMDVPSVLYPDPLSIGPFSEINETNCLWADIDCYGVDVVINGHRVTLPAQMTWSLKIFLVQKYTKYSSDVIDRPDDSFGSSSNGNERMRSLLRSEDVPRDQAKARQLWTLDLAIRQGPKR